MLQKRDRKPLSAIRCQVRSEQITQPRVLIRLTQSSGDATE